MKQATVKGMSCAHCAAAVMGALEELGLTGVLVDLETGLATFAQTEETTISREKLTAAIEDAGFEVGEIS